MSNYFLSTKITYDWYLELRNSKIDQYIDMEFYIGYVFIRFYDTKEQVHCDYLDKYGIYSTTSKKFRSKSKFLKVIK